MYIVFGVLIAVLVLILALIMIGLPFAVRQAYRTNRDIPSKYRRLYFISTFIAGEAALIELLLFSGRIFNASWPGTNVVWSVLYFAFGVGGILALMPCLIIIVRTMSMNKRV